ncbi:hypothetical protein [Clavibacter nebraskensis]|uniref:Uncharacterized protein n=1 Tax=Clavibacter nebraskensis TaxID=31963 RepID=A0A399Q6Q9_9MICO|nr:hypothetical protein [Clavibacter nebraskensis]RIJ13139.1 hypothetical protein DZF97_07345 [Clavibacter nebraskensis]UKF27407.1 hypothetical protein FGQ65_03700 [Clavibacter nebraskensis]UQB14606.1 hypothetical protein LIX20_001228 [Clavibacter nebraskensis]UQB17438.1 hypothetical protein LIX22_001227 [Clavibacter nebraskensis]
MTRTRRRVGRGRLALLVGLTVLLVGAGSTAGYALWSSSTTTSTSVRAATVSVTSTGFDQLAGAVSSQSPSLTATVVVTNTGSGSSPWTGTVSATTSTSADRDLAGATRVVAWSTTATSCSATASVGSGSVSGTWASPPRISGTLAGGARATWCVRTTASSFPTSGSATVTGTLGVVLGSGSWTGRASTTATQTAAGPAVTGGFACTPQDGNWYVVVGWDTSVSSLESNYNVMVDGTRIATSQGYYGKATISRSEVPATLAPDGTIRVTVDLLDSQNQVVRQVASGTVVAFTQSGARGFRCS